MENYKDEDISAFAFHTAKKIEEIVNNRVGNIETHNKELEARILTWYTKTRDKEFAKYFEIKEVRDGKV